MGVVYMYMMCWRGGHHELSKKTRGTGNRDPPRDEYPDQRGQHREKAEAECVPSHRLLLDLSCGLTWRWRCLTLGLELELRGHA